MYYKHVNPAVMNDEVENFKRDTVDRKKTYA